ncbi:MAG: deoxynucleoside kinase [Mycoplasma sp.]|nr:deoxynucleoside kinase [Mycoplasma sp.]
MKQANLIIVGGPISVGKSTLVSLLPWPSVSELDEKDEIQKLMLENTYKKGRVHPTVIENYFLQKRRQKYELNADKKQISILDRSIFESLWFAKSNMNNNDFKNFEKLWRNTIKQLIKDFGKPKIYILLTCSWDTFKKRIFKRGRLVELSNFNSNEVFFKNHIKEYENHMKSIFEEFQINYMKIETDSLSTQEVYEVAKKKVESL